MTLYTQTNELRKFKRSKFFDKMFANQHCTFMYIDVVDHERVKFTIIVRNEVSNTFIVYVVTKLLKHDEHVITIQPQVLNEQSMFAMLLLSNAQAFLQLN